MTGTGDAEANRLRWRCRRGMRELDILLERYLAERWPTAAPDRRVAFRALLELPDPELAALFLGYSVTHVTALADVVAEITHCTGGELSAERPVYTSDFGRSDRPEREP